MELPRASWRAQPWKNGGGVTHEIWRLPADGDYDLRVSIAEVSSSGPFSQFPGYRRWSFLVGPAPIALNAESLVAVGDHVELPGDLAVTAELRAGATSLLNILARVPIVVGRGAIAYPVRFAFDLRAQIATIDEPAGAGCIWIA